MNNILTRQRPLVQNKNKPTKKYEQSIYRQALTQDYLVKLEYLKT